MYLKVESKMQSTQCSFFGKNRGFLLMMWVLMVASIGIAWHSHQLRLKINSLMATANQHGSMLGPMMESQAKLAKVSEDRWKKTMDAIKLSQAKPKNKEEALSEYEKQVKQYVSTSKKNTTEIIKELRADSEAMLLSAINILESKRGVTNITQEFKKQIANRNEKIPIDKGFFKYDEGEVQKMLKLDQDDNELVKYVKQKMWVTPSPRNVPYNLKSPGKKDRSEGQLPAFLDIFTNTTGGGYFIECGAFDGEEISNTLDLEERYNWTGALIEGSPSNFELLSTRNRKSVLIPACLSLEKHPTKVQFVDGGTLGKIFNTSMHIQNKERKFDVLCMPFYTIYKALERKEVDLFILDIEGHENEILHTIPFDKVNILVLIAEFSHGVRFSKDDMRKFMLEKDYRLYEGTKQNYWPKENYMFIKKGSKYDRKHP